MPLGGGRRTRRRPPSAHSAGFTDLDARDSGSGRLDGFGEPSQRTRLGLQPVVGGIVRVALDRVEGVGVP